MILDRAGYISTKTIGDNHHESVCTENYQKQARAAIVPAIAATAISYCLTAIVLAKLLSIRNSPELPS